MILAGLLTGPSLARPAQDIEEFLRRAAAVSTENEAREVYKEGIDLANTAGVDAREVLEGVYEVTKQISNANYRAGVVLRLAPLYVAALEYQPLAKRLDATAPLLTRAGATFPHVEAWRAKVRVLLGDYAGALEAVESADRALDEGVEVRKHKISDRGCRARLAGIAGEAELFQGRLTDSGRRFTTERELVEALVEEAAADPRASSLPSEFSMYIHQVTHAVTVDNYDRAEHWIDRGLGHTELIGAYPRLRPYFLLHRGLCESTRLSYNPGLDLDPVSTFDRVLADASAQLSDKQEADTFRAFELLRRGELEQARDSIRAYRRRQAGAGSAVPTRLDVEVFVLALETLLDVEQGLKASEDLSRLEDAIGELRAQWKPGTGGLTFSRTRAAIGIWMELVMRTEPGVAGRRKVFEAMLEIESGGTLAKELGVGPTTLEDLAAHLPPRGGFLFYFRAARRSHAFLLDEGGLHYAPLATRDQIEKARSSFLPALLRGDAAEEEGARLARELLPGSLLEPIAGLDSLTVAGLDRLGYVPFECLPFGEGSRLGLEVAVGYVPSLVLVPVLPEPEVGDLASRRIVVLGGAPPGEPRGAGKKGRKQVEIPFGSDELEELTESYEEGSVIGLLGEKATPAALTEALADGAHLLHLIAHGVRDNQRDVPAGLQLAADGDDPGRLWAEQLDAIRVPFLVVLSSCGAGRGPVLVGDPASTTLEGALLRQGAGAVLWSRGDVEFHANLALMIEFHQHLAEGATIAEALRRARVALAGDGKGRAPRDWGMLHASGTVHRSLIGP